MRRMRSAVIGGGLALAGCQSDREVCDALLSCTGLVNPFLLPDAEAQYGPSGSCWSGSSDLCADACEAELLALWLDNGLPACDPERFVGEHVISQPEFSDAYIDKQCEELEDCDSSRQCYDNGYGWRCYGTFDPDAAEACLDTPAECSPYGFPIQPDVCYDVCQ